MSRKINLEKQCVKHETKPLRSCVQCKGIDTDCSSYVSLRDFITRAVDHYFMHRLNHRSHPGQLPDSYAYWAEDTRAQEIGKNYSHPSREQC